MSDITVVIGFDMVTEVGRWGLDNTAVPPGPPKILDLYRTRGITGTFFFTGATARLHPEVVRSVKDAGHEVGCHSLYHETVGDPIFEIPGVKPLLPEEVPFRLKVATDWVAEALGERPVSFRCPRLWGSTAVCNALDDLGYVADASYPLYCYEKQLVPYHPSREDWRETGDLKLIEIPNFCDMTVDSTDEYHRDRDQWPLFRTQSAAALMEKVEGFVDYVQARKRRPVLCFYLHPWEFHPMPQGALDFGESTVRPLPFIVKNCGPKAVRQLDLLCGLLKARGARFATAGELAADY